ncbi:hypothetical protein AOLI_G00144450 [Acnodon oligacanthus]
MNGGGLTPWHMPYCCFREKQRELESEIEWKETSAYSLVKPVSSTGLWVQAEGLSRRCITMSDTGKDIKEKTQTASLPWSRETERCLVLLRVAELLTAQSVKSCFTGSNDNSSGSQPPSASSAVHHIVNASKDAAYIHCSPDSLPRPCC